MKEELLLLPFLFCIWCRIILQHIVSCLEDILDKDWGGRGFCGCYLDGFRVNVTGNTLG